MQILKTFLHTTNNAILFAPRFQQVHQFIMMVASHLVGITVLLMIAFVKSGKMLIQCRIKIFPVALTQSDSHAETKDSINLRADTII